MEQMIANGIQLIKTNASYVFDSDTVFYRNEIPFANQSNEFDITDCYYAQPIDFTDVSVLQFLSVEASVTCVVKNYLGVTLDTINATNVGTYDTQNVFNVTINWSTIVGNLEHCYLQITDGTEYFKSEPLKMINLKQRVKIRYRMLRNHKSVGYFFNPNNEAYEFFHIFYIEAAVTEFKREIVKSVFEDSNQNLINLFGTFRHSFLLKTFQVSYYMHEKVVTLSLCDEIYLSEIKAGNEYEGRIFLSKDETPQEEIIEGTNLYVSSTRYVVDNAFRLVGAAQETPVVPDPNLAIVSIHHTNPNGKKSTFQTPYKLLPSKTLYTPQGSPTDYLFKIGGSTDNFRNSHDVAWGSIPSKTFAEFSALTVNADLHVQVRYIGGLTQTDIVATLHAPIDDAPINPSTRTIKPNTKTANNDFLIYPKLVTGFDSVGISTGAATLFSQQRTFAQLANSSDLTNFNAGVVNLPITTEDGIGHLYLQRSNSTGLTVNITTNQSDPKKEIIAYCIPNNNEFYPTTSDGANPNALKGDGINDILYIPNGATGSNLLYPEYMLVGESRTYTTLGEALDSGIFIAGSGSIIGDSQAIIIASIFFTGGVVQYFVARPNNKIHYLTTTITRTALTGTAAQMYQVVFYFNGLKILPTTIRFSSTNNIPLINQSVYHLAANSANRFSAKRSFFAMHDRALTFAEIRKIHLGGDLMTIAPAKYYYDFTNLVVDGGNRRINNIGTGTIDQARLENSNNESDIVPLF